MHVEATSLADACLIKPEVFGDQRGYFFESWNARDYQEAGIACDFVQDNQSCSPRGVLRGLHYQIQSTQAKLVWAQQGEVYDVIVDLRRSSPTFGRWHGVCLTEENKYRLLVPRGFAHGFLVLSETAVFCYKCDNYYAPQYERSLLWNDSELDINWPLDLSGQPILSAKDAAADTFANCDKFD